ncbi:DUF3592 domain-containing protein (plasmid) [Burkholderia cenocepacia]|uniref:DUF3592 domain-containing protein n=1 Tax=Burkholderia cepacia complex TaxID=87882 RepID=UPI0020A0A6B8|nr:DUF3592 domain-containing protein [Burkholderia cenocepacia]MCO8325626.1 DUF3592 domain-containing protein [Burkholderia cenocepacia]MCO8332696.1 DUF3592 domain-containing protein [Burkholderia cenocepacia]MCO8340196.1 DUF3592 domain-containing protein [Burkholderia cenocepacia]MCO8347482.1 DUF3592 domain-containing protein [Burkholderia cenocepacia]MCO8360548.1 DUF3592 domain-containing protein [Burkholderia cenocepacia]
MFKATVGIAIGVAFLITAAIIGWSTRGFLQTAIAVPGEVVSLNAGGSHPQIEFVTKAGERVSYPQGGMIYGTKVGDKVTVLYQPEAPARTATIDKLGAVWNWTLMAAIFGVGFILFALMNLPPKK